MALTLQELHELTGKVLKERPELAEYIVNSQGEDVEVISIFGNTVYLQEKYTYETDEEILWQSI